MQTASHLNGGTAAVHWSPSQAPTSTIVAEVRRCPVEFGHMVIKAREAQNLNQLMCAAAMNKKLGPYGYGQSAQADYSGQFLSKIETGAMHNPKNNFIEGVIKSMCAFFDWQEDEILQQLQQIQHPQPYKLQYVKSSYKARRHTETPAPVVITGALQPHETTMLDLVLKGLEAKTSDPRNGLEDELLVLADAKIDLATILQSGLAQMPHDKRIVQLSAMLQLVYGKP